MAMDLVFGDKVHVAQGLLIGRIKALSVLVYHGGGHIAEHRCYRPHDVCG